MIHKIFLCVGFLHFICIVALGQDRVDTAKTEILDEVLVTGTRTERKVSTLPLPTQIITGENIRRTGLSRLNEIIQEQTGLIMVPSFGGGEGLQMQGLDAAYVMILIDGQPLFGRSAGTLDLSRITALNIERIEIVKGASSSLYGSEALAGVVNVITKKSVKQDTVFGAANYKLSSFNTHDFSGSIEFSKSKISADMFANYFRTSGYNLTDNTMLQTVAPFQNVTLQPRLYLNFSEKVNLNLKSRYFAQNQVNKSVVEDEFYEGKSSINEWNHSALLNHKVSDRFKMTYDIYATNYRAAEFLNSQDQQLFSQSYFNQWYLRPEIRSHFSVGKHMLTSGVGMNYELLDRTYFVGKQKLNSNYLFSQFEWFKQRWNVLAGFRYDHHQQYRSQFSPKLAVNYSLNPSLSLKSSVGYGYKAPDLRQLYFDFTNSAIGYTVLGYAVAEEALAELQRQGQILSVDNISFASQLKPESSINFNLGAFFRHEKFSLDFNSFYNIINDLIDTRAVAKKTNGQNVFSYFNIKQIFTSGFEVNSKYQFSENLWISTGYQYLIAKDKTTIEEVAEGNVFARDAKTLTTFRLQKQDYFGLFNRSRHSANLKINYMISALQTSISARGIYRSKYGLFDTNNNQILDDYDTFVKGYFLTNIAVNKGFKEGFTLQLGVNNLFNYTDKVNISNLPGRQYFGRVMYQF